MERTLSRTDNQTGLAANAMAEKKNETVEKKFLRTSKQAAIKTTKIEEAKTAQEPILIKKEPPVKEES